MTPTCAHTVVAHLTACHVILPDITRTQRLQLMTLYATAYSDMMPILRLVHTAHMQHFSHAGQCKALCKYNITQYISNCALLPKACRKVNDLGLCLT